MRDVFTLVRGAVSTKDLLPVLTHFAVHEGHVHGTNGRVHICAPAPGLRKLPSFTASAARLLAAVDACVGEPELHVTEQRCTITDSGSKFRAHLPRGGIADYPLQTPPTKGRRKLPKGTELLPVLEVLRPFIGEDASRPWCPAIRLQGTAALATNNVVLAAMPLPKTLPEVTCTLPVSAVEELLRIGEEPVALLQEEGTMTFFYAGGAWLRCALLTAEWPDALRTLQECHKGAKYTAVSAALRTAVEQVAPFCANPQHAEVVLEGTTVRTAEGDMGAEVQGAATNGQGAYHAKQLSAVLAVARKADWSKFPRVPWRGLDGLEGVLMGLRSA